MKTLRHGCAVPPPLLGEADEHAFAQSIFSNMNVGAIDVSRATWYTEVKGHGIHLQSGNGTVQKYAGGGIELSDAEIAVAGKEAFAVLGWSEFNRVISHRFAEINPPFIEANIAPAVDLNHMIFAAIIERLDPFRISSAAGSGDA